MRQPIEYDDRSAEAAEPTQLTGVQFPFDEDPEIDRELEAHNHPHADIAGSNPNDSALAAGCDATVGGVGGWG